MTYRHSWLDNHLITWLVGKTGYHPPSFNSLKTAILEVLQNINDHSGTNIGCIFAQYYPNRKRVLISIADFGVGVPHKVRSFLGQGCTYTDVEAVEQACEPDWTTGTTSGNAGRGLPILIDIGSGLYKGIVKISSGRGYLLFSNRRISWKENRASPLPGCAIEMAF